MAAPRKLAQRGQVITKADNIPGEGVEHGTTLTLENGSQPAACTANGACPRQLHGMHPAKFTPQASRATAMRRFGRDYPGTGGMERADAPHEAVQGVRKG